MEGYGVLLASAFLAATILPFSSEAVLAAMALSGGYETELLWLLATLGNVGGALVNWWLGRSLLRWRDRRWFPVGAEALEQGRQRFLRYGVWSLLLAWVPVIGDPLTFMGGVLRVPLPLFTLLVTVGKGGRYLVVLYFTA